MSEQKLKPIDKSKKSNRRCCNCEFYPKEPLQYFATMKCEKGGRLINYWNCCGSFTWSSKKAYKE